MIKTILFDVDGTLIDSEFTLLDSLQQTLVEEKGLSVPIENLEFVLGIPRQNAIRRFASSEIEESFLLSSWTEKIKLHSQKVKVFPKVKDVLIKLKKKDIKLGIVTSKTTEEMRNEFNQYGLNKYFNVIVAASDTNCHMPSPVPIGCALEELHSPPNDTLYIGSSIYEMHSSQSAGVKFALAKWGAKNDPLLSDADFQLNFPTSILDFL